MGILTSYLLRTQDARVLTHSHRSWNLVASSKGFSAQIEARPRPRGVRGFSWVCWFWLDDVENASSAHFPNHEWDTGIGSIFWLICYLKMGQVSHFHLGPDFTMTCLEFGSHVPLSHLPLRILWETCATSRRFDDAYARSRHKCNKSIRMSLIYVLKMFETWSGEASPAHCLALGCWLLFAKGFHHAYHLRWSIETTDIWQVSRKFKPPANRQPTWFSGSILPWRGFSPQQNSTGRIRVAAQALWNLPFRVQ